MQYSNTTTKDGLVQRCEVYTSLGDGAISGDQTMLAQFTSLLNSAYEKVVTIILESIDEVDFDDSNYSDFPVATATLVSGQRDYAFPTDILKIKRIDITYDGTNWYKAEAFDIGEYVNGVGNDTIVDSNFQKSKPKYDTKYNSIWVYPLASDGNGQMRIEYTRDINSFTTSSTTTQPGIDKAFHPLIAKFASLEWAISKGLSSKNDLNVLCQEDEVRIKKHYGRKNEDRDLVVKSNYISYR